MKKTKFLAIHFTLFLAGAAVLGPLMGYASQGGGVSGGGGNGLHLTPQQTSDFVKKYLSSIVDSRLRAIHEGLASDAAVPIREPKSRKILSDIMNLRNVVQYDPTNELGYTSILNPSQHPEKLNLKMTGACNEFGQDRDASVTFHKDASGEPVMDSLCMSAERLSIYPYDSLENQIGALLIHEFSHIAGYDEPDAIFVQTYTAEKITEECDVAVTIRGDGPSEVDVFDGYQISLKDGYYAVTDHMRSFAASADNTIEMKTTDFASPLFFLRFSGPAGGEMQFLSLNSDGSVSTDWVSWGSMATLTDPDDFGARGYSADSSTVSSQMQFDGKTVQAARVETSAGCLR